MENDRERSGNRPSTAKQRAALLIAEGRFTSAEIAGQLHITDRTLRNWKKQPRFAEQVTLLSREFADTARKRGLGRKEYRINTLANLHSKALAVIDERANDPLLADVPGGRTGLIAYQMKQVGQNLLPEYLVDTGLLREIRAIQELVAKELGHLTEKAQVQTKRSLKDFSDEELKEMLADLRAS